MNKTHLIILNYRLEWSVSFMNNPDELDFNFGLNLIEEGLSFKSYSVKGPTGDVNGFTARKIVYVQRELLN